MVHCSDCATLASGALDDGRIAWESMKGHDLPSSMEVNTRSHFAHSLLEIRIRHAVKSHYIRVKLWVFLHRTMSVYRSSASTICTTIPVAAPPPLQIAATPYSPFLSWCKRVTMILEPELPSAWPRAMAPPRGLTFEASRLRICVSLLVEARGDGSYRWYGRDSPSRWP